MHDASRTTEMFTFPGGGGDVSGGNNGGNDVSGPKNTP